MSKIGKIYIGVLESEVVKRRPGFVIRCVKKEKGGDQQITRGAAM